MVLLTKLPETIEKALVAKLFSLSDAVRRNKAYKINNTRRQTASLVGGLLLRYASLENDATQQSLSHSGDFCAVAVHDMPVGVDIQYIKQVNDNVIKRVCTDAEIEFLKSCDNKTEEFIRLWTLKEAYFKSLGKENSLPIIKTTCFAKKPPEGYRFESRKIESEYILSICYKI